MRLRALVGYGTTYFIFFNSPNGTLFNEKFGIRVAKKRNVFKVETVGDCYVGKDFTMSLLVCYA